MVEYKCKVCGRDLNLSDSFCPKCGFEHHILPELVSNEVRIYEEKRIKAYKKAWEEHKQGYENLKKNYEAESSKNKTLEHNLNDAKAKIAAAEQEKGRLKGQVDKAQKELASAKKEMQGLVDKVQSLASQKQALTRERDNALAELERQKENPSVSVGAQIRVAQNNGKYTLYDKSGIVRRSNGVSIGENGIVLYDGCVFQIEELIFKVKAPEFNLDDLIL